MKCTSMKHILALLSWGLICNPKEPEAFIFAKMEVGHPVKINENRENQIEAFETEKDDNLYELATLPPFSSPNLYGLVAVL